MSTKYGRNFTNFQNVSLSGSGTASPEGVGMLELKQGLTNAASTVSISMISGSTDGSENGSVEAPYFHISNAGLSLGTGIIRLSTNGSSPYATIALSAAMEEDAAYKLPALNGMIGVGGTVRVDLETIAAGAIYTTNIVLDGSPDPDQKTDGAYIFAFSKANGTASTRGMPSYISNTPSDSGVQMVFQNLGETASVAGSWEMAYVALR